MAKFENAFTKVVSAEGGYVNNPNDRGGETYIGIARKFHKDLKMWDIIDKIKVGLTIKEINKLLKNNDAVQREIKSVYRKNYWDILKLDNVSSQRIANQFFDIAVNCGTTAAIKAMQRVAKLPETGRMNTQTINYYARRIKN